MMIKTIKKIILAVLVTVISLNMAGYASITDLNPDKKKPADVTVHQYSSTAAGIFSNAFIIELEKSLVVVDATLTVSSSQALRKKIDSLRKPISAILITHGHPDHYNGLGNLTAEKDIPIYSTQPVLEVITEYDAAKEEQWKPVFGDEWPENRIFPNHVLNNNETITFGGVDFTVRELGPGESHSDSYWLMESEDKQYAFIGDVVLNGVHAYLADGHYKEWLQNLAKLKEALKEVDKIYPGHGEPGGTELFSWQEKYITIYVSNVKELLGDNDKLSEADKAELVLQMKEFLPNDKLEFLIGTSADVVASQIRH